MTGYYSFIQIFDCTSIYSKVLDICVEFANIDFIMKNQSSVFVCFYFTRLRSDAQFWKQLSILSILRAVKQ